MERRARIDNLTARDLFQLHGTNPHTALFSEEGDISNLCQFKWHEWCHYQENTNKFPFNREILGRVLGPAKGEGNEMAQWVLKANGKVVPRRTARPLQASEIHNEEVKKMRNIFDKCIEGKWGASVTGPPASKEDEPSDFEECEDDDEAPRLTPEINKPVNAAGKLINQQPAYNKIINSEVQLQINEQVA